MRYYVVADIHGFYDLMLQALREQGYYSDKQLHKLIICGDLFDRCLQNKQIKRFVLNLLERDEIILIKGNNEDLLIDFVEKLPTYVRMGLEHTHHYSNGAVHTVAELIGSSLTKIKDHPEKMTTKIKQTDFFRTMLPTMRNYYETEHYIFVHGWIPSITNGLGENVNYFKYDPNWRNADGVGWYFSRWYNGMLAAHQGVIEPNKTIVCGHWHTSFGHAHYEGERRRVWRG